MALHCRDQAAAITFSVNQAYFTVPQDTLDLQQHGGYPHFLSPAVWCEKLKVKLKELAIFTMVRMNWMKVQLISQFSIFLKWLVFDEMCSL